MRVLEEKRGPQPVVLEIHPEAVRQINHVNAAKKIRIMLRIMPRMMLLIMFLRRGRRPNQRFQHPWQRQPAVAEECVNRRSINPFALYAVRETA